jgi:hypothetical protein
MKQIEKNPDEFGEKELEVMEQIAITSNLEMEFTRQSSLFARWSFLSARTQDVVRGLEEQVEISFYELYDEYRQDHHDAKENECKSFVRTHADHQRLTANLRDAQHNADVLKAAVKAFEMRASMLMQLGAARRSEYDSTDMKIRTESATKVIRKTLDKKKGQ